MTFTELQNALRDLEDAILREIFATMSEVVGYGKQPGYGPARKGDVVRIVLDPSRAQQELGWKAQMPLFDGLAKTYAFFRDGR